jgi:hypothetical protein
MPKPSDRRPALSPTQQNTYDHYDTALAVMLQAARALAAAPVDELLVANMRMDTAGIRYVPSTGVTAPVDRQALESHRGFFALVQEFATGYRALTAGGGAAPSRSA